jgi:cation:H+ antiporter
MVYLLLLIGFALLVFSGRILIRSSVSIARHFKLSTFVIGLTVVAIGTSAPELLVSLTGAIKGHTDLAVYNVIGSNISNVLLVLAIAALILPIPVKPKTFWLNWGVMFLFSLLVFLFLLDLRLSWEEGLLIFILLIAYIIFSVYRSRSSDADAEEEDHREMKIVPALLLVVLSSGGLALGANLLVDNAVIIAMDFGISERIISVSLIAVGTSIPELTTSAIAALRKQTDISIGNIIGSNIFNLGFVLGITSMIKPLEVNPMILSFDIYWLFGIALALLGMLLVPPKLILSRWKGMAMLMIYLIYLYLVLH